jgi:Pentapeptide repeats (8 copies)
MQEASQALFALMDSEEEDFPALVARFGIDPAIDLQYCDLSNVDFGGLVAETLNLTGSNITGANLSRIRCKNVIGAEREIAVQSDALSELFQKIALAIQRYQNSDWVLDQIVYGEETHAPILAFYDSAAEQDVLTKRLCNYFAKGARMSSDDERYQDLSSRNFLWFYTRSDKSEFKLDPISLDRNFLKLIMQRNNDHDIGVYPFLANRNSVQRIEQRVKGSALNEQRVSFARAVSQELASERGLIVGSNQAVILFSGFPPLSKKLYEDLRTAVRKRLRLVFLCSSQLEQYFNAGGGRPWRKLVVPAYSVGEQLVTRDDVARLARRVNVSSNDQLSIGSVTLAKLDQMVERPLREMKEELLKRLNELKATAAPSLSKAYVI